MKHTLLFLFLLLSIANYAQNTFAGKWKPCLHLKAVASNYDHSACPSNGANFELFEDGSYILYTGGVYKGIEHPDCKGNWKYDGKDLKLHCDVYNGWNEYEYKNVKQKNTDCFYSKGREGPLWIFSRRTHSYLIKVN